jgi:F0F1-type ATP synthase assembly protein I
MPLDHKPQQTGTETKGSRRVAPISTQLGAAMELPFSFVGAVFMGGLIGFFLDKWLHTGPWLMVVFGCFGFVGGILEIVRRFNPKGSGKDDGRASP